MKMVPTIAALSELTRALALEHAVTTATRVTRGMAVNAY